MVDGTSVYDHSYFGVRITNPSKRAVVLDSVQLISAGTASSSGLAEIRDYWQLPDHRLGPGEAASIERPWGFEVDTAHQVLTYRFDHCWHGVDEDVRQCAVAHVDLMPR